MYIEDIKKEVTIIYGNIAYVLDLIEVRKCNRREHIEVESKGQLCNSYTLDAIIKLVDKNKMFNIVQYKDKTKLKYSLAIFYMNEYHLSYLRKATCRNCGYNEDILYPPMTIGPVEELKFGFGQIKCLKCNYTLDKHAIRIK